MSIKKYLSVFLLCITTVSFGFEKVGTTSFQFLKVLTSARASALGGAYVTLVNSPEAVFWNPAGLTKVNKFGFTAGYADWFLDVSQYSFSAVYNMDNYGTFGIFGMYSDIGTIEETTVSALGFIGDTYNPGLTGRTFSPSSMVVGISYARDLNDKFTFGVNAKFAREDLIYKAASTVIFDGGFLYNTGFKSIVIGASIRNFGPEVKFIDKSFPLPQTLSIGVSTTLIGGNDPMLLSSSENVLIISYDMEQPRDYTQLHKMGIEYQFNDMIALRAGYKFNGDQEGLNVGAGVKLKGYSIDYSYSDHGEYLENVHRLTIGLAIN